MRKCWKCSARFPSERRETRPGSGECENCAAERMVVPDNNKLVDLIRVLMHRPRSPYVRRKV